MEETLEVSGDEYEPELDGLRVLGRMIRQQEATLQRQAERLELLKGGLERKKGTLRGSEGRASARKQSDSLTESTELPTAVEVRSILDLVQMGVHKSPLPPANPIEYVQVFPGGTYANFIVSLDKECAGVPVEVLIGSAPPQTTDNDDELGFEKVHYHNGFSEPDSSVYQICVPAPDAPTDKSLLADTTYWFIVRIKGSASGFPALSGSFKTARRVMQVLPQMIVIGDPGTAGLGEPGGSNEVRFHFSDNVKREDTGKFWQRTLPGPDWGPHFNLPANYPLSINNVLDFVIGVPQFLNFYVMGCEDDTTVIPAELDSTFCDEMAVVKVRLGGYTTQNPSREGLLWRVGPDESFTAEAWFSSVGVSGNFSFDVQLRWVVSYMGGQYVTVKSD